MLEISHGHRSVQTDPADCFRQGSGKAEAAFSELVGDRLDVKCCAGVTGASEARSIS